MSGTTNLNITVMTESQNQKYLTHNNAIARLANALTETFDANVTSGSVTLTSEEYRAAMGVRATNATVAGRTVTLPAVEKFAVISNPSTNTQTVDFILGSVTVTLAIGEAALIRTDGTTNGLVVLMRGGIGFALTDGDKGDITVSSSGTNWQIDANAVGTTEIADTAVTLAKMANLAQDTLIGRQTASTGVPEAITCTAAGRALLDDANAAAQRTTLGLPASATVGHNFTAVTDPTVNDDTGDGYVVGSQWFNTATGAAFRATDVTLGAAVWVPTAALEFTYTSSGSFNAANYPGIKGISLVASGASGGGGGGARVTSGNACSGGGGGGGSLWLSAFCPVTDLYSSLTITIGAAGTAGAGATVDNTAGGNGGAGGFTDLGYSTVQHRLYGGGGGAGGQLAGNSGGGGGAGHSSAGASSTTGTGGTAGSTGGGAGGSGGSGAGASLPGAAAGGAGCANGSNGSNGGFAWAGGCGGGAGGGISAAPVAGTGGNGRSPGTNFITGGAATGAAGTDGAVRFGGHAASGSGGGANTAGNGGNGGAGLRASGAGGGGSAIGGNGGNGGVGSTGFCIVVAHF
jgi:hypothetical protein